MFFLSKNKFNKNMYFMDFQHYYIKKKNYMTQPKK